MFGTLFDKVTGLLDRRFVLGLLLPVFAFAAGAMALVATLLGWTRSWKWWLELQTALQVMLGIAAAVGLVFAAIVLGTQVAAITRIFEGYWSLPIDKTAGKLGRRWHSWRRRWLGGKKSDRDYQRWYLSYAPDDLMPTRLGNVLLAAECYPGDAERWGLDAVFWWPRLHLLLPDSARAQVDEARGSMDQMLVLSMVSLTLVPVAVGLGLAGVPTQVWLWSAVGALLLSWLTYRAAVSAAAAFGQLVRSCFDLFRTDLMKQLGWIMPARLADEQTLWRAIEQQLYRRGVSRELQAVIDAARLPRQEPDGQTDPALPANSDSGLLRRLCRRIVALGG